MPTNHDAVAALPTGAAAEKALLRNLVTKRMAYVLADADTVTDLVAVDPATGVAIIDILYLGRVFHYDATDTTTAHDGTTCLVTSEGRRYKLAAGTDVVAYSVLDRDLATPPGSPALGDAYLVAAGATGAWAGHSDDVAVYTIRGWEFIDFGIGRLLYVEDIDSYYHKNAAGTWLAGFGTQTLSANSVPLSAAINFGKRLIVENQTTTAPPGSPTVGTAYIIGPSATGAWAGHDAKIAICEVTGSFTIYTPGEGWAAYDKNANNEYIFNGSAWISAAGAILKTGKVFTAASAATNTGGVSGTTNYSATSAPSRSNLNSYDAVKLTYTARAAGARLRFVYRAEMITGAAGAANIVVGLNRDSEASALDWSQLNYPTGNATLNFPLVFETTAVDAAAHDYWIVFYWNASSQAVNTVSRRLLTVEEFSL